MRIVISKAGTGVFALSGLLAVASSLNAAEIRFEAHLGGSKEMPAVETAATGTAHITYDTRSRLLSWHVEHSGLSGNVAAAHFHGPADRGENAPPAIDIDLTHLEMGSATLDAAQAADLLAERWYLNLHTKAHPGGEIRGQVVEAD